MDAQIIKPSGVAVKGHQGRTRRAAGGCGRLHTGRKQKIKLKGDVVMSKWTRLLAVLLCVCLLFTSCAPVGNEKKEYSQEVQNLEKLCKVWGYP